MAKSENTPPSAEFNQDTAVTTSVQGLKDNWQKWSDDHQEYQRTNPFSQDTRPSVMALQRGQEDYGRPPEGSMTDQRGKAAHSHISREVQQLCDIIRSLGEPRDGGGGGSNGISVKFGKLFAHYVTISNKLVGILLRARKQRLVDFEGEMLWQGKDDHVVITLIQ